MFARAKAQWDTTPRPPAPKCASGGSLKHGTQWDRYVLPGWGSATGTWDCCQQCGNISQCANFSYLADTDKCYFYQAGARLKNATGVVSGSLDNPNVTSGNASALAAALWG